VSQLDTIQKLIGKRSESISICEELKKSIFLKMFVDHVDRNNWEFEELKTYIIKTRYGIAEALNSEGGVPTVRMNNITYLGSTDLSDLKYINANDENFEKYELKERDILFNRTNSVELVGKCTVWGDLKGYIYAGYIFTIKLNEKKLNPYYLVAYLNSDLGKKILKSKAKQSGNMANFSASLLGKQKVLIPPISIQKDFEKEINVINRHIEYLSQSKKILQQLFNSALQNTFKEDAVIDEEPIFKELIKKFDIEDLKGNKKRLQFLIDLFDSKGFDDLDDYSDAKEKLFQLIEKDQIIQELTNNNLKLKVK